MRNTIKYSHSKIFFVLFVFIDFVSFHHVTCCLCYNIQIIHHMATTNGKTRCVICSKEKATSKCGGCSQDFCYNHWDPHCPCKNKSQNL
jgi:hypothetical protein